ncbi:hypothetical protein HG530_008250 [Fusarium avenaceum]|nr:hypothetical protein HG530_008250 [Fusarium avenaceum]
MRTDKTDLFPTKLLVLSTKECVTNTTSIDISTDTAIITVLERSHKQILTTWIPSSKRERRILSIHSRLTSVNPLDLIVVVNAVVVLLGRAEGFHAGLDFDDGCVEQISLAEVIRKGTLRTGVDISMVAVWVLAEDGAFLERSGGVLVCTTANIDGTLEVGVFRVKALVAESVHGVATRQFAVTICATPVILKDPALASLSTFPNQLSPHVQRHTLLRRTTVDIRTDIHEAITGNIIVALLLTLDIRVQSVIDRDVLVVEELLEVLVGLIVNVIGACGHGFVVLGHGTPDDGLFGGRQASQVPRAHQVSQALRASPAYRVLQEYQGLGREEQQGHLRSWAPQGWLSALGSQVLLWEEEAVRSQREARWSQLVEEGRWSQEEPLVLESRQEVRLSQEESLAVEYQGLAQQSQQDQRAQSQQPAPSSLPEPQFPGHQESVHRCLSEQLVRSSLPQPRPQLE